MGAGGQRKALTMCAACGRELGAAERRTAHDLTLSDRILEDGRRTQRTRIHALLCDPCARELEGLIVPRLKAEAGWDRSRTGTRLS